QAGRGRRLVAQGLQLRIAGPRPCIEGGEEPAIAGAPGKPQQCHRREGAAGTTSVAAHHRSSGYHQTCMGSAPPAALAPARPECRRPPAGGRLWQCMRVPCMGRHQRWLIQPSRAIALPCWAGAVAGSTAALEASDCLQASLDLALRRSATSPDGADWRRTIIRASLVRASDSPSAQAPAAKASREVAWVAAPAKACPATRAKARPGTIRATFIARSLL